MTEFARLVAAVFFANLMTAGFLWACWGITRLERHGPDSVPGGGRGYYIILAFVGAIGLVMLYLAASAG